MQPGRGLPVFVLLTWLLMRFNASDRAMYPHGVAVMERYRRGSVLAFASPACRYGPMQKGLALCR